jgi:hypothetical protein
MELKRVGFYNGCIGAAVSLDLVAMLSLTVSFSKE